MYFEINGIESVIAHIYLYNQVDTYTKNQYPNSAAQYQVLPTL